MEVKQRMYLSKLVTGTITESLDVNNWEGFRTLNKKLLTIKCTRDVTAEIVMTGGGDGDRLDDLVITITIPRTVRKAVRAKMVRKGFKPKLKS